MTSTLYIVYNNVSVVTKKKKEDGDVSMDMKTEFYPLISAQQLAEAYVKQQGDVVDALYGYHPANEQDWHKRMTELQNSERLQANAQELAKVLGAYNAKHGNYEAAAASIDAIASGAPVIAGGQQAGLWTGPILVIHKAISIIQAAREAENKLGKRVVPVFWIAGEDHDWDEVNHTFVISAEQSLKKLSISREEEVRTSVSKTMISAAQWEEQLAALDESLPGSEFKSSMMERLRSMAMESASLSDMFAKMLAYLFQNEGLVLLDADDPEVRKLESQMFEWLIEQHMELGQALTSSASKITERGFPLQAELHSECINLFRFHPELSNERILLYKHGDLITDRKNRFSFTLDELSQIAKDSPEQLSNNVMTRPLMQSYLFPVLGTVLGTGEIAYWGLLKEAFGLTGLSMPIIIPRTSFTLVEGIISKNMDKYSLSFQEVIENFEERKEAWLKQQDNLQLEQKFSQAQQSFQEMYEPLIQTAASIQSGLAKLGDTNMNKILEQIEFMKQKTIDAHNKQFEAAIRQLDRIKLSIVPAGRLQERVVTVVGYWNRYGEEWIEQLLKQPASVTGGHFIVYL